MVDVLQNWLNWFHFPFPRGMSTPYSETLPDFSVTIPRCYKDIYVNSLFPHTSMLWNSLSAKCFPLKYILNGLKSLLTHRYSDQEGNGFQFSKFSQKMDIESFPIKSEDFVTGYAPIMRASFMSTLTNPY